MVTCNVYVRQTPNRSIRQTICLFATKAHSHNAILNFEEEKTPKTWKRKPNPNRFTLRLVNLWLCQLLRILDVLILWCWHIGSMKLNVNMRVCYSATSFLVTFVRRFGQFSVWLFLARCFFIQFQFQKLLSNKVRRRSHFRIQYSFKSVYAKILRFSMSLLHKKRKTRKRHKDMQLIACVCASVELSLFWGAWCSKDQLMHGNESLE